MGSICILYTTISMNTCHSHNINLIVHTNIKVKQNWLKNLRYLKQVNHWCLSHHGPLNFFSNLLYFSRECDNCKIKKLDYWLLWKQKPNKNQIGFLAIINILLEKLAKNVRKLVKNHQILLNIGRKILILQRITMSYVSFFKFLSPIYVRF